MNAEDSDNSESEKVDVKNENADDTEIGQKEEVEEEDDEEDDQEDSDDAEPKIETLLVKCMSSDDSENDSEQSNEEGDESEESNPENIDDPFANINTSSKSESKKHKRNRIKKKKKKKYRYEEDDDRFQDAAQLYDCVVCKEQFGSQKKLEVHVLRAHPGEKPYKCPLCGLGLTRMTTYKEHMNTHTGEKPFECNLCDEKFSNSKSLQRHRERHDKNFSKQCHLCKTVFRKWNDYKEHKIICRKASTTKKAFKCPVCGSGINNLLKLIAHMESHMPDVEAAEAAAAAGEADGEFYGSPFIKKEPSFRKSNAITPHCCQECGNYFATSSSLGRHKQVHSNNRPHKCSVCDMRFIEKSRLEIHFLRHTGEKPHACPACGTTFREKKYMIKHVQNIHRDMIHKCLLCDETFTRINDLFSHEKLHRNNGEIVEGAQENNQKCLLCDVMFESRSELLAHRRTLHAVSDSHLCYLCGKGFKKIYSLNLHLARHSSDQSPPHLCTECGKSFRVRRNLNIHMKMHMGNQPYNCEHCHEGFFERHEFDNHIRVHMEERPHVCTVCGKRFKLDLHLKTHMQRLHMGDKPFKCKWEGCKMSFTTKISLSKHYCYHTGEKPVICTICGKTFTKNYSLKVHLRNVHAREILIKLNQ